MTLLRYLCFSLAAGLCLAACEKSDKNYKDFAPNGENVYPGKVDSLKANPGKERIQLAWLLNTDPRIVKCRIFWNRKADSVEIAVSHKNSVDTIRHTLELGEGPYIFEVYTYNAEGDRSIKAEVNGDVFGNFYESGLLNRILKSAVITGGDTKLEWEDADPRSPGVLLSYQDQAGVAHTQLIPSEEKTTLLTGTPTTGTMEFKTLYLPVANAIDTFAAVTVKVDL
ncbi:DUF4998 domain-containing protein [Chitinophaga sp. MM2321]|uniref:DUF4998 domain-containing protein n=1 Tax=Chitinophaga sp. MM2321 TaxID=3137178 RepID=UPI0032D578DA